MSIIPAINRAVVTGRSRDDVDEALDSVVVKSSALAAPADTWARHGVEHPLGTDFSGMQDLVPQTIDEQTVLAYTAKVPASLMRELIFNGTPDEVIDQLAEWRDHGLRYSLILNASPLNPRLRKTLAANAPFLKILRRLKSL
jgi:phthiodiolone/phenolphthiodiolone dimycocerosates ketoreductase